MNTKDEGRKTMDEPSRPSSLVPRPSLWVIGFLALTLTGCAEIAPPTPQEVLESPFGKGPLRIGMSKDEVRQLWGEPGTIDEKGRDKFGTAREVWIYQALFEGAAPIDVGYATKSKVLEFDGENLVAFHD